MSTQKASLRSSILGFRNPLGLAEAGITVIDNQLSSAKGREREGGREGGRERGRKGATERDNRREVDRSDNPDPEQLRRRRRGLGVRRNGRGSILKENHSRMVSGAAEGRRFSFLRVFSGFLRVFFGFSFVFFGFSYSFKLKKTKENYKKAITIRKPKKTIRKQKTIRKLKKTLRNARVLLATLIFF